MSITEHISGTRPNNNFAVFANAVITRHHAGAVGAVG